MSPISGISDDSRAPSVWSAIGRSVPHVEGQTRHRMTAIDGGRDTTRSPAASVYDVEFSSDGSLLATSCGDETVRVWDVKKGVLRHTFAGGGLCVAVSPDGKRLAGDGGNKLVYLWEVPAARKKDPQVRPVT